MPDYGKPIYNNLHWKSTLDFFKEEVGKKPSTGGQEPAWKKDNPMWAKNPEAAQLNENMEKQESVGGEGISDQGEKFDASTPLPKAPVTGPDHPEGAGIPLKDGFTATEWRQMRRDDEKGVGRTSYPQDPDASPGTYPYNQSSIEESLLKLMKDGDQRLNAMSDDKVKEQDEENILVADGDKTGDAMKRIAKEQYPDGMSEDEWRDVEREYRMGQQQGPRAEGTIRGTPQQLEEEPISTQRSAGGAKVTGVPADVMDNPLTYEESHKLHGPNVAELKNSLLKLMDDGPFLDKDAKDDPKQMRRGDPTPPSDFVDYHGNRPTSDIPGLEERSRYVHPRQAGEEGRMETWRQGEYTLPSGEVKVTEPGPRSLMERIRGKEGKPVTRTERQVSQRKIERPGSRQHGDFLGGRATPGEPESSNAFGDALKYYIGRGQEPGLGRSWNETRESPPNIPEVQDYYHRQNPHFLPTTQEEDIRHETSPIPQRFPVRNKPQVYLNSIEKSLLKLMKADEKPRFRGTPRQLEPFSSEEPMTYRPMPDAHGNLPLTPEELAGDVGSTPTVAERYEGITGQRPTAMPPEMVDAARKTSADRLAQEASPEALRYRGRNIRGSSKRALERNARAQAAMEADPSLYQTQSIYGKKLPGTAKSIEESLLKLMKQDESIASDDDEENRRFEEEMAKIYADVKERKTEDRAKTFQTDRRDYEPMSPNVQALAGGRNVPQESIGPEYEMIEPDPKEEELHDELLNTVQKLMKYGDINPTDVGMTRKNALEMDKADDDVKAPPQEHIGELETFTPGVKTTRPMTGWKFAEGPEGKKQLEAWWKEHFPDRDTDLYGEGKVPPPENPVEEALFKLIDKAAGMPMPKTPKVSNLPQQAPTMSASEMEAQSKPQEASQAGVGETVGAITDVLSGRAKQTAWQQQMTANQMKRNPEALAGGAGDYSSQPQAQQQREQAQTKPVY